LDLPIIFSMGSKLDRLIHAAPRLLFVFAMGAVAVPASVAFTFWGRGSIEQFSWVFLPAVLLGPLSLIGALGLLLYALRSQAAHAKVRLDGLLPDFRPIPRLLSSDGSFYRTVGAGYEFFFADPSGWESGPYDFSDDVAAHGHWETWD
jgi:hypothetical protein